MTKFELLEQLSGVGILMQDLRLFLNVNPTNQAAISDFKQVTADYKNLVAQYEGQYGSLTGAHDMNSTWTSGPWPWQNEMGGHF